MNTLWLAFARDSSLPPVMDNAAKQKFEAIFDEKNPDSPWHRALAKLGLRPLPGPALIRWLGSTPYIHWSYVVERLSAGMVSTEISGSAYRYRTRYSLRLLPRFIYAQWKISLFILRCMEPDYHPPQDGHGQIAESIALGLAMLTLTFRLPAHTPQELASWLAKPEALQDTLKKTVMQLQRLQMLRTALTPAWLQQFPASDTQDKTETPPEYFWNEPPATTQPMQTGETHTTHWQGIPVSGHAISGRAMLVTRKTTKASLETLPPPLILVFALARPESVEWYDTSAGMLFAEGGAMSHACTVARELNLPCITALGRGFLKYMENATAHNEPVYLSLSPATGRVEKIAA